MQRTAHTTPACTAVSARIRSPIQRVVQLAVLSTVAGCFIDLEVSDDALIECHAADQCPTGFECNLSQHLCVSKTKNRAPTISVGAIGSEGIGRPLALVELPFTVLDDSLQGTVSVEAEYTIADNPHADNAQWVAATPMSDSEVTNLPPEHSGVLTWNALADALLPSSPLAPATVIAADGAEESAVAFQARVTLRAFAIDSQGKRSSPAYSATFAMGNTAPVAVLEPFSGEQAGLIILQLELSDMAGDLSGVTIEFREGAGIWRRALTSALDVPSLLAPATGQAHQLIWYSEATPDDDAQVPQGLGQQTVANVEVRIRGYDEPQQGVTHAGLWTTQTISSVRNQTPPQITGLNAPATAFRAGVGPIPIQFTLLDEQSDWVDVRIEYSSDFGMTWSRCQEDPTIWSEGFYDLATAPAARGGVEHHFHWETNGSFLETPESVFIRVWATDNLNNGEISSATVSLYTAPGPTQAQYEIDVLGIGCGQTVLATTADMMGDAAPELVAVCSGSIAVVPGSQSSTGLAFDFAMQVSTTFDASSLSNSAHHAVLQDVDGDNNPDLVVLAGDAYDSASDTSNVQIWLSQGNGGFAFHQEIGALGSYSFLADLAVADVDGDEDRDALLFGNHTPPNGNGAELLFLQNDGSLTGGLFAAPVSLGTVGSGTMAIAAADFTGDGRDDFLASNWTGATLISQPEGSSLTVGATYPLQNASGAALSVHHPAIVDIDGNGFPDVLYASSVDHDARPELYVLRHTGDISGDLFEPVDVYQVPFAQVAVAVANINGDSANDVFLVSRYGELAVMLGESQSGQATGKLTASGRLPDTQCTYDSRNVAIAVDRNNDGLDDLMTMDNCTNQWVVASSNGVEEKPQLVGNIQNRNISLYQRGTIFDMNADGRPDWLIGNQYLAGTAQGSFTNTSQQWRKSPLPMSWVQASTPVDIDRDGDLELMVVWDRSGSTTIAVLDDLATEPRVLTESQSVTGIGQWSVCDINGDGASDIAMTTAHAYGPDELVVFFNESVAAPQLGAPTVVAIGKSPYALACADLDEDGRDDVVVSDYDLETNETNTHVLLADDSVAGGLRPLAPMDLGGHVLQLIVTNLNDDGHIDLVVCAQQAGLQLLAGRGDGTFTVSDAGFLASYSAAIADVNRDGAIDIITTGNWPVDGPNAYVLYNGLQNGLATGSVSLAPGRYNLPDAFGVATYDANRDGAVDVAFGGIVHTVMIGQDNSMGRSAVLRLGDQEESPPAFIGTLAAPTLDRFQEPRLSPIITVRRFQTRRGGVGQEVMTSLRASNIGLPRRPGRITHAWELEGDTHLVWVSEPEPVGERWRPVVRSELVTGDQPPEALSLDGPQPDRLGFVIEIPLLQGRNNPSPTAVHLYRLAPRWRRAEEVGADPLSASADGQFYLPRLTNAAGEPRQILERTDYWQEILMDDNGDLTDGDGPRFVILDAGSADARLRIRTERLGVFQAVEAL